MRTLLAVATMILAATHITTRLVQERFMRALDNKADYDDVRELRADVDALVATKMVEQAVGERNASMSA